MEENTTVKTVLVVEDEPMMLQAISDKLGAKKFAILGACDGVEGLAIIRQKHPDMILLDIAMPNMDGLEMLKQLRQDEWGAHANVIVLTNFSYDEQLMKKIMALKPAFYLVKSENTLEQIVLKINEALSLEPNQSTI